ncbi:hypothetical protein L7F22_004448 [Adiantum nelumboides]|nr:hypothetical protein [Adiantum nelumboides]
MAVSGDNSSSSLHSLPEHSEPFSSCLAQQFAKAEPPAPCDSFLQPLHHPFLPDFTDPPALQECWDSTHPANAHLLVPPGSVPEGSANGDRLSARRLHKADREKLRRDKLNEQFTELASALDPDRPKNDKATILGESVQVVKDLRDEVKRLKTEHASLLDESRDLTQEKNELREEKATLKNETEQLQNQIQQRLRASSPWMTMDPSMMMSAAAFPYPVPVQQPISAPQPDSHSLSATQRPLLTPAPFMPLAPPLPAYHMHPNLQPFPVFGNRPGDVGGTPYIHYAAFTGQPISSHSHVERPYAQYPSTVQPMPGYVVHIAPSPGSESQPSSRSSSAYKACVPGIPVVPVSPTHGQSKSGRHHPSPSESSSQHTSSESKQDISSAVEPHACSAESFGPSRLLAASHSLKNDSSGLCQVETAPHATAAMRGAERRLDISTDQIALSCAVGGVVNRVHIGNDNDSAHDPTLRPPAA